MKKIRIAATALAVAALVAASATPAQAAPKPGPWSPWTPIGAAKPSVATGYCSVPVRIEDYRISEVQRTRSIVGGTEIEIKGEYAVRLTPLDSARKHYIFDASGTSLGAHSQIAYDNGDFLARGTGANFVGFSPAERKGNALPPLAITHGAQSLLFIADGNNRYRLDVIERPARIVDLCKAMGVPS